MSDGAKNKRGIDEGSDFFEEFNAFTARLRQKILSLRKEKKLTQEQMEAFELTLRQFQRIESGETTNPTLANLFKIAKALGVSPSQLLDI